MFNTLIWFQGLYFAQILVEDGRNFEEENWVEEGLELLGKLAIEVMNADLPSEEKMRLFGRVNEARKAGL